MNKPSVSLVLFSLFCLLALPAIAGQPKAAPNSIAAVDVSDSRVEWVPAVDAERWTLTLSGPRDFFLRRQFEAGETPFLSLFDAEGGRLQDGTYAWELRGQRQGEADTPEAPSRPQGTGKDFKTAHAPELSLSGRLEIRGGSFVAPTPEPGAEPPEAPLQNVIAKDSFFTGKLVNTGNACIGDQCNSLSDADFSALKLRSTLPHLKFDDVALPCEGCPTFDPHDWAVFVNQSDIDQFAVSEYVDDVLTSTPFTLRGGAPDNSLFVAGNGSVGLGTSTPATRLDVKTNASGQATARVQNSSATGYSGIEYLTNAGLVGLFFGVDNLNSFSRLNSIQNYPLVILTESIERMRITSAGKVGIGTASPATKVDVSGSDGLTKLTVRETSGTASPREMIELRNTGDPLIIFTNTSPVTRYGTGLFGTSYVIDNQGNAGVELQLSSTGNLTIAGVLTQGSSRDLKTDFSTLAPQEVLARVASLPVSLWSYKTQAGVRHVGPMAEDFHALFGLGEDEKHIAPGDQAGIALLAVQGLNLALKEKDQEIADLQGRIKALEDLVKNLMQKAAPETTP